MTYTKDQVDDAIQNILQHIDFTPLVPYKEYLETLRDGYVAAGDSVKEIRASSPRSELEYIQDRWQTASRIQWLIDRIEEVK